MSNSSIIEAVRNTHPYEEYETRTFPVPTIVNVEVPVGISEEAIFAAIRKHFDQLDATLGLNETGSCKFRADGTGSDKNRCAFGVLIPDAVYDRAAAEVDPEARDVDAWISSEPELGFLAPHTNLLKSIQSVHDGARNQAKYGLTDVQYFLVKLQGLEEARSAHYSHYSQIIKPKRVAPVTDSDGGPF